MQSRNCLLLSDGDRPKRRGNYTGERLKMLRPETYRHVVELLAEPRQHVSYREICRRCHVTDDTVKAVERREAVPIAARKQELMVQAARIAKRAADRVEDEIGDAPLPQAVVTFGVMTDKIVALSNDPQRIDVNINQSTPAGPSLFERINALARAINAKAAAKVLDEQQSTPTDNTPIPLDHNTPDPTPAPVSPLALPYTHRPTACDNDTDSQAQ
jgi:hypothetical protein